MGQKVDPRGLRLGITRTWDSIWYADKKEYAKFFHEDTKIREMIKKNYFHAGISKVKIERTSPSHVVVLIHTAKAGIIIGRKGSEIESLRAKLEAMTGRKVTVKVQEVKEFNKDATLVAENIATSIEKRVAYKRAVSQAVMRAMKAGAKGIKTAVSGRLGGADMARTEFYSDGTIPLQTLRADIDYGFAEADTTYGKLGVKTWIYHGEVLPTKAAKKEGSDK